jgi:hypothetical protein
LSRPGPSTSWRARRERAGERLIRPLATSITATAAIRTIALEQRLAERLLLVGLAMQAEGAEAAWPV